MLRVRGLSTIGGLMDYSQAYGDALNERMLWLKLDTDFMHDFKVRRFSASSDWRERYAKIGLYVATITLMASNDGHIYDLSDDLGWQFLATDLNIPVEDAERFVRAALEVGLFDRELYAESCKLASLRLLKEAEETAKSKAAARSRTEAARASKASK